MSGLCGIVDLRGRPVDPELLQRMARPVAYRGPDGVRAMCRGGAGLCHLALHTTAESWLDRQPLSDPLGGVLLVADARLDNRRELIAALETPGEIPGEIPGDAGLILAAYLRWGDACLDRLLGDFAFVLWDARANRLLCACDPLGVKALHYARYGSIVLVATEAQQILAHPAASADLDFETVGDFLLGNAEGPDRTYFREIRRLPPAHRLVVSRLAESLAPYWQIDPDRRLVYRDPHEYAAHLREILERAVADRLRTQSPTMGIAMSGGLDSGSVAALARHAIGHAAGGEGPDLFACSFVFDRLHDCDERSAIAELASALPLEVALIPAEQHWLLDDVDAFRPGLDSPFLSWESCFQEMLQQVRARGARVLLTGHGGDDVLGGSGLAFLDRLRRGDLKAVLDVVLQARRSGRDWRRALYRCFGEPLLPPGLRTGLRRCAGKPTVPAVPEWIDSGFARRTALLQRTANAQSTLRFREAARQEIYEGASGWIAGHQAVDWYDRSAARRGIEVRHPFLDRRLVEFVVAIPAEQLFEVGCYKSLLRRAMVGALPESIRGRSVKVSLESYFDHSLRETARPRVESLLAAPRAADWGILDANKLRIAYIQYRNGILDGSKRALWYALTLELWLREHHDRLVVDGPEKSVTAKVAR